MAINAPTPILNLPVATGVDGTYWVPTASTNGSPTERVNVLTLSGLQGNLDQITTVQGSLIFRGATEWDGLGPGTSGYVLSTQGPSADPVWVPNTAGSVTSVALALPSIFTVTGSPVTSSGTLTGSLNTQTANTLFAGPSTGSAAVPTFRALVNADISAAGAALTKTDDTNVTATLGGSASTSLVNAASIALGWTGQLSGARGGTGVANTGKTITLGGNVATSGAFDLILTLTGATNVTLPTSGTLATTAGPNLPSVAQGDLLYGSASNVLSALTKNTTATRYLANTGTSNNPAWAQVNLANGITGTLGVANGGTGQTTLTNHGVLVGAGTSGITQLAAAGAGTVLAGVASSDPAFTATPSLTSITLSNAGLPLSAANTTDTASNQVAQWIGARATPTNFDTLYESFYLANSLGVSKEFARQSTQIFSTTSGAESGAVLWGVMKAGALTNIAFLSGATFAPVTNDGAALGQGSGAWSDLFLASGGVLNWNNGTYTATQSSTNLAFSGSISLGTQLSVANGGTGATTLTNHGVLLGQSTSAIAATAVGSTGSVLAGNSAADPTFQTISAVLDNIGSTRGQILYRGASAWSVLSPGSSGNVLSTGGAGADPSWISVGGTGTVTSVDGSGGTTGLTLTGGPITGAGTLTLGGTLGTANGGTNLATYTQGDLLYASSSSVLSKLAKDTNATRYLSNTGTTNNPAWAQIDLTTGVTGILPGANGGTGNGFFAVSGPATSLKTFTFPNASATVLTSNAAVTVAQGGTGVGTLTNHGVLLGQSTSNIVATSAGTAGQILKSGGASADPAFADNVASITFIIDGGGVAITTGVKGDLLIPFACTITQATLLADQSGSIVVNVWVADYSSYPPTVSNKITASAPPTITTAVKSQDSTLTGWTTSITAGQTARFNVDSITTIQRVTLTLKVLKT